MYATMKFLTSGICLGSMCTPSSDSAAVRARWSWIVVAGSLKMVCPSIGTVAAHSENAPSSLVRLKSAIGNIS